MSTSKSSLTPKEKLIKALLKDKRYKFRDLRSIVGCTNKHLESLISECRADGLKIVYGKLDRTFFLSRASTPYSTPFDMSWLPSKGKLGLVSDTHLCSDAERLDLIEKAYTRFSEEGIKTVIHAGDITDGWEVYRGHVQHVKVGGAMKQAHYAIKYYPKREGIRTFYIGGNHDLKSFEKQGVDQASMIASGFDLDNKHVEGRKDLVYLGQYSRFLYLPHEITGQVLHPHGGSAYAISYPQQKRSREMRSDTRPHLQLSGHFHTFNWLVQDYTHMVALPAFQDETEFFIRLGFGRQMGFCILEYQLGWMKFEQFKIEHVSLL